MQLFTPSTILLLVAISSLMTAAVSAERATTCESSSNVHHLRCDNRVISVQAALYGRADRSTCSEGRPASQVFNMACSQRGTVDFVRKRCNAKKECEINIGDVQKPDPCQGTFKYLDTNYTCLPAIRLVECERTLAYLYCNEGQVIFVYICADYGRRDETTCAYRRPSSQTNNIFCFGSTNKVAESCNGKNSCTVRVENSLFGDPCPGTYKYLEVAYVCEYPRIVPHGH